MINRHSESGCDTMIFQSHGVAWTSLHFVRVLTCSSEFILKNNRCHTVLDIIQVFLEFHSDIWTITPVTCMLQ